MAAAARGVAPSAIVHPVAIQIGRGAWVVAVALACRPTDAPAPPNVACFPEGYGLTGALSETPVVTVGGGAEVVGRDHGAEAGLPDLESLGAGYEETRIWVIGGLSDASVLAIRIVGAPEHRRGMVWRGERPVRSNLHWERFRAFLGEDFAGLLTGGGAAPPPVTPDGRERPGRMHDATYLVIERLADGKFLSKRFDPGDDFSDAGRRVFDFVMGARLQPSCEGGAQAPPVGWPAELRPSRDPLP